MDRPWKRQKKVNLKPLEKAIILMAINDDFLKAATPLFNDTSALPNAPQLITAIRWVIDWGQRYGSAPRENLDERFKEYQDEFDDDAPEVRLMEQFLLRLNEKYQNHDYDHIDLKYELEKTEELIQSYFLAKNANDIIDAIKHDQIVEATEIRKSFNLPSIKKIVISPEEVMAKKIMNSSDLLKKKIKEPTTIIDPWLTDGSITMIYSPRGIGKTWLCLIIASEVTRVNNEGAKIGNWIVDQNAGVLYLDGEMSEFHLKKRLLQLIGINGKKENKFNPLTILSSSSIASEYRQQIRITDEAWRDTVYDFLAKNDNYQLVILDNIASLASGLDENDKKAWDPINEWVLALRHLGVAVIFVHHAGKGGAQRGTSGREDNVDNVIKLGKGWAEEDYDSSAIYLDISFEKARNIESKEVYPFGLKISEDRRQRRFVWEKYRIPKKE